MSLEKEAKKIEEGGKAVQSALEVPVVKYAVIGALAIVGLVVVKLLFL